MQPREPRDPKSSPPGYITKSRIDVTQVIEDVSSRSAGATVLFLGTVRDHSEFGHVDMIDYDAYVPMAEKQMRTIEEEVKTSWPECRIRMVHRFGVLKVGEISVAVAASAPHRKEAFEACRFAIEKIKNEVPIWKKERLADGTSRWVEGKRLGQPRPEQTRTGRKASGAVQRGRRRVDPRANSSRGARERL